MVGSSEELVENILEARELLGIDRFFGQFDWGCLPRGLVEESLHRYGTEIAPAVRRHSSVPVP
jgi:hypothetical protein